jgi:hypothetical protein
VTSNQTVNEPARNLVPEKRPVATAQTIEAYVGETMDDARMGPVHTIIALGLVGLVSLLIVLAPAQQSSPPASGQGWSVARNGRQDDVITVAYIYVEQVASRRRGLHGTAVPTWEMLPKFRTTYKIGSKTIDLSKTSPR